MDYFIELNDIPEVAFYVAELADYGEITRYSDRYPRYVWIESPWDKDIIEGIVGVKQVWTRRERKSP